MLYHENLTNVHVQTLFDNGRIALTGHKKLKIYCKPDCRPGTRMLQQNRVFFENEQEALELGYRPCGHCFRDKYRAWKEAIEKE